MEDLLQKQVRDSCKLALPEGLQDLMSDISREVLRAQPQNLLQFITDHLAALLVARENLFVASRICDDVCKTRCYPELEDELREVGLSDADVEKTVQIVTDFFESGGAKETNLLIKLLKETEIDETQLPAVLEAVRGAFLRHQVNNTVVYESSSTDSDMDESLIAAKHTLKMYRKTKEPGDNYNNVVEKIQAAYRAYNVRRKFQRENRDRAASPSKKKSDAADKTLRFDHKKVELLFPETPRSKRCSSKASSVSLAGSFVPLPRFKPYSIDDSSDVDEVSEKEKERVSVDYTEHWNIAPAWDKPGEKQRDVSMKKKNISFHDLPQIMNKNSEEVDEEIPEEVEQADDESDEVDEELLQEQLIKDYGMSPCYYTNEMEAKTAAKNKCLGNIIQKVLRNEELAHAININEGSTNPIVENTEALNQGDNDIKSNNLRNKEVLSIIKEDSIEQPKENAEVEGGDNDGIINEVLRNEKFIDEPNVTELANETNDQNAEQKNRNDYDIVDEELTHELVAGEMVEKEALRNRGNTQLIPKQYEAQNKDADEIFIEELINEPEIAEIVVDEMVWYGDSNDRLKEDSDSESKDSDTINEYFDDESAAASFTD